MKRILVRDFMTPAVLTLKPSMRVLDAVAALVSHRISGAPVVDDRRALVGMLTERDCLRLALQSGYFGESGGLVDEYMSRSVQTVPPDLDIVKLASQFLELPYRRYPVVSNQQIIGIISRRDILSALIKSR